MHPRSGTYCLCHSRCSLQSRSAGDPSPPRRATMLARLHAIQPAPPKPVVCRLEASICDGLPQCIPPKFSTGCSPDEASSVSTQANFACKWGSDSPFPGQRPLLMPADSRHVHQYAEHLRHLRRCYCSCRCFWSSKAFGTPARLTSTHLIGLTSVQEAKPSPPPQPVPQLARAPARAPKQVQDDEKPPLEAAEAAPAAANEGLAIGSRTAKPAPQPQDVAVPELSAPKPRRRQDVGASTAEQAAPSTAGQSSPGESAAADKLSLAEPSQAEPTRIRALPRGLAATAEADKSSKPLEAALSAMQEEEQAGELDQAPPAAAPLSKPVPLPVPQQLGKPRARAAPEQTSQPLSGSTMDSASIDTSAGSRPSAVAPTTVSSETQPAGGAPAVPLEAGESAEGLQELSPAASQRTAATGVQEAAVTTPEAATADKTAAEEGAGELSSIELPLNLPDTPKPPLKPAQPPAKRSAPAQQAAQVIIRNSQCCKSSVVRPKPLDTSPARRLCREHTPAQTWLTFPHILQPSSQSPCRALIRSTGRHSGGWPWRRKPRPLGGSCLQRLWLLDTAAL